MSDIKIWYVDNDMVIECANVIDNISGNTVDDATITATLKDSEDVDVTGQIWPVTLDFVSSGLYRKTVDKAVDVLDAIGYTLHIDLVTPGGNDAHWEIPIGGETRTS